MGSNRPTNGMRPPRVAGIKLGEAYRRHYGSDFIAAIPTKLNGPGDNYDPNSSRIITAPLRKAHDAGLRGDEERVIWGTGTPRREFLYVDDCADALVLIMQRYSDDEHINVGSGEDLTIGELAQLVCDAVGFKGEIACDLTKPDGTSRKLMSGEKLRGMGWSPRIRLPEGLANAYAAFKDATGARI